MKDRFPVWLSAAAVIGAGATAASAAVFWLLVSAPGTAAGMVGGNGTSWAAWTLHALRWVASWM